jgi:16S rRNA (adenine1518-N6/adenine1519-N6)-dimethyltransferase
MTKRGREIEEDVVEPRAGLRREGASPDGLPSLRHVIETHGLRAKKNLGQNFLLDLNITRKIARLCGDLTAKTILEVGPGPGGLTRALLLEGAARVVAIERDERCRPALDAIGAHYPDRLAVHFGDALEADWRDILKSSSGSVAIPGPVTIAANLPYGIASLLLAGWLETEPWPPWFDKMVLMFQREVAERIVAEPGSKAYGRLSVLAQWRTSPRIVMNLPAEAFTPPPKVASAVVEFIPRRSPEPACSPKTLARVTQAAFGQRRKMLRQSLKTLTPMPELLLAKAGIDPTKRAEQLTVADFAKLAALSSL